jgi:hypothetical protein
VAATAVGVVLALVVVLSGSDPDEEVAGVQGEGVEPRAEIQSPAEGQQLPVGQPLEVQGLFAHPDGIARVELQVDGAFVGSVEPEAGGGEPPQTFETAIDWPGPQDPGSHQLLLFAVTASGERIDATLAVNAVVPEGSEAFVEAPEPANVREYPTTDERFPPYGQLQPGERNKILGQLASGEWFLIEFLASPSGQGWVFSQLVTVVGDLATVPVVEDPQIPAATPSSTPTETATPTPTEEVSTEYDIEPRDYQGGFVEIKNNGPGPFSGAITFFYLAADTVDGCQLNTQSGHYTIDDVEIPAGQVLSIGFDEVAPPEGLFCVGIEVEGETDNTNNAIGPYQGPPPAQ